MSTIRVKQIDQPELTAFVTNAAGGAIFSGQLNTYVNQGGYLGSNVVYASGVDQLVSGQKTFVISPVVPYSGATGAAPSRKYVDDLISSVSGAIGPAISGASGSLYARDLAISGVLAAAIAAGAAAPNGVTTTGDEIIGGFKQFTGSPFVPAASQPSGIVNLAQLLVVSGLGGGGGGGGTPNAVTTTGNEVIGGFKTFTGSPLVPAATQPSGATNLAQLLIVSGIAASGTINVVTTTGNEIIGGFKLFTGSPFVPVATQPSGIVNLAQLTGISGVLSAGFGSVNNTYYVTGTGTINLNYTASGSVYNTFNDNTIQQTVNSYTVTGNFNIASFFFDPVITGLNVAESFVGGMGYIFTGAAFSCRSSGTGPVNGGILSGRLYQIDFNNTEQTLYNFTFNSGLFYSGSPGFSTYVTGRNRVGVSITNSMSGIQKFCVGIFGGTYV